MGTFKNDGRNHGPERRRDNKPQRRRGFPNVESLEGRILLDGASSLWKPTSTDLANVLNGPMANEGETLINVYQDFLKGVDDGTLSARYPTLRFQGNMVGIRTNGTGDFNAYLVSLTNLGMRITASNAAYGVVEGMLPISALPTVAQLPQTLNATPSLKALLAGFQGVANNEANAALKADTASAQYNVNGAGVTIGVLSDSVNQFQGGLSDSVKTGDLPNNVKVLQDFLSPPGTDEGRAMLENIHDIAPGASLAFASAANGEVSYQNNIVALSDAGAKVEVDDVGYADEPFFQDGFVAQGINTVVAKGVTYLSAKYNTADQGYLSNFRAAADNVSTLGSGTYMNFNPGGGAPVTQLPITIAAGASATNPAELVFQFDQPYASQQPAGSTAAPTSQIEFYVLDSTGKVVNTGSGPNGSSNGNIVATRAPLQFALVAAPGSYTVVIKVASGANPGHVEFQNFNENVDVAVSKTLGSSGGTYYQTGFAHASAISNIGVGAVPWWAPTPFLGQTPLNSEPFSSYGPGLTVFNPDGSAKSAPVLVQAPVISGPDGGNTSFFGQVIDTSTAPFPGQPKTTTNLSQPNLPSFFGTSSAAPNVAAVVALMDQRVPSLTPDQIKQALIASAQPLNGASAGTWNLQGGYGIVNAVNALAAVDLLRVSTTTPANGSTVTIAPTQILVSFNKPVLFSTITAADLTFLTLPAGVTAVTIGQPVAVDDPLHPTQVSFPFTFTVTPNKSGNGAFAFKVASPAAGPVVLSYEGLNKPGKALQPFNGVFTINDMIDPRVINTTVNGRIVTIQFSEPMAPSSITPNTLFLARTDSAGNILSILNNDPRFKLSFAVDKSGLTSTATLDYSGLDQTQLPTGYYKIVVRGGNANSSGGFELGATDLVGNKLDGEFAGVFPSGEGDPITIANPTGRSSNENFVQFLGLQTLTAPIITSLTLQPQFDTGIPGDENTNANQPVFVGQVTSSFPGSISGLTVLAEFNALHGGSLDLAPLNGRGYTGNYDVAVTTDSTGKFILPAPFVPEGFNRIRLVVVGQADSPPLPGFSSSFDHAFRVDNTAPNVVAATLTPGGNALPLGNTQNPLALLTSLSLDVVDPASPSTGPLATPGPVIFPALDPSTATNISNYSLTNTTTNTDESSFISTANFLQTGADFVAVPNRQTANTPYFGRVDLTFSQGLPAGIYKFTVHTQERVYGGLTDAAGNPIDSSAVPGNTGGADFVVQFNIQPQPVFIESVSTDASNASGNTLLPRSYYEINPRAGDNVSAPPTTFYIDVSNPLDPTKNYTDSIQLIRSADNAGGAPDGNFGTLGVAGLGSSGNGFTRFAPVGTTVTLTTGAYGPNTRLVLQLPAGTVLPADHYRLYIPNTGANAISDIYGNQLDGEFLGNPAAAGVDANGNPAFEDLIPTGQYRPGMSGDGVAGGAFMTGFVVVPTGNLVYARPDYIEDPLLLSTTPDGSISKPYSVLAPQAAANALNNSTLNNGDPNGGLNSSVNFFSGFNSEFDRAGLGKFARSAFYAAQQLASRGPVVIVALPGTPQTNPITGVVTQQTFVLQAPAGTDPVANDGSGSVPFDTSLIFNPGSTLKLENASLFVQNQGSSVQTIGGANPNDRVTFTSYADDTVGGDTNHNGSNTSPRAGDWGGIVFRNFDQAVAGRTDVFPIDGTLTQGPHGGPAVAGEDDALSSINFANITYGGGAVPATQGIRYDEITLYNSRPAITNDTIIGGPGGGSQATISGDLDSFREDDTARGPLVRRTTVSQASINGIWVRPLVSTGLAEATDAIPYPDNPVTLGGVVNYTFSSPLPYVLTSVLDIGTENLYDNFGKTNSVLSRLYVQPGMMVKSEPGAGIRVLTQGASFIVGDRTYIHGWDSEATTDPATGLPTSTYSPTEVGFKANTIGDARVVFTSTRDNTATTSYFDPVTQQTTIIVPAIDTLNTGGAGQPTPGNVPTSSRWGRIQINSGVLGTIDEADIRYGGAGLNVPGGTNFDNGVLQFTGAGGGGFIFVPGQGFRFVVDDKGTRFSVTNNNLYDNADVPMSITPDGLLAADTLRPLSSGAPFFRGNIFQRNVGGNGLLVEGTGAGSRQVANVDVNSLWDSTDLTYIVRNSIVMGGGATSLLSSDATSLLPEPKPVVVLTVQSALPGTLMPNGQTIPRPGESVIIKLDNHGNPAPTPAQTQAATLTTEDFGGAGFLAGVDNGVDPTGDPLVDVGAFSQMRFLGIGGSETTGQQRVPVVITSIHDDTAGTTVRGVKQFAAIDGDTTAPKAGDGGLIYFGGNELPSYSVLDPRGGSIIDNADIRYITRIEQQGGGIVNYIDANKSNSFDAPDDPYHTKAGSFPPLANGQPDPRTFFDQYNAEHAMIISNSNLSTFLNAGIIEQPGFNTIAGPKRSGIAGQPNLLFVYNTTIANMPIGVQVVGQKNPGSDFPEATEFLSLNNTFYNDPIGVDLNAVLNTPGHIHFIAMDNIFDGSTTAVVQGQGSLDGSTLQYNLFFNDGPVLTQTPGGLAILNGPTNFFPVNGDPSFRDAANGNFQLKPNSAAIDAARSELSLNPVTASDAYGGIITTLLPVVNQTLDPTTGIRSQTTRTPDGNQLDPTNPPTDQLSLPGSTSRGFIDEWVPTLASDPQGIPGPTTVPGTWIYKPAFITPGTKGVPGGGERDALGYLRIDDPAVPNTGFGSRPFFDIGAFEYRPLFPPHITGVTATVTDPTSATGTSSLNLYKVGGFAGTNKLIQTISVQLDHSLDPTTVNGSTVLLEASGGDGIFGNGNNSSDKFYNLSGKVTFNSLTNVLTINVGAAGLVLGNDEYRLELLGSGTQVLRDPQGNALDGENTLNDDPNNPQLPLPSGDGFPGGIFYDTFVINTTAPTILPYTFGLDPSSDTSNPKIQVTKINLPAFSGTISVAQPTIDPLAGQTAIIDISTLGNGVFDRLNAGSALTDSTGHFVVTIGQDAAATGLVTNTTPLPDSPYNVGPDGIIRTADDSGYTWVRVRIIDQSGNVSNLPTDPISSFIANNAMNGAVIDTAPPKITGFTPTASSAIQPDQTGKVTFTFTTDKNLDPLTVTTSSILVFRAGPSGVLGNPDQISVPVDTGSIAIKYLGGGPKGPQQVTFTISGSLPNDLYSVTLKGTGTTPIADIAGVALDGLFNGSFPSGADNIAGSDFTSFFAIFSATNVNTVFVQSPANAGIITTPDGTRAKPYPTITAALKQATPGDVIAVLPGVYTESITLKPFVRLLSAALTSTNGTVIPGNAQQTVIRAPARTTSLTSELVTVFASGLPGIPGVDTEISGFTIASPLLGDPALGVIDPNSAAIEISNSNVLIDRNYVIDAHIGVKVISASNSNPRVLDSGLIGNDVGILVVNVGAKSLSTPTQVINDTLAFNTIGLLAAVSATSPTEAYIANNIFWENHDQSAARGGTGIAATSPGKLTVLSNLFSGNGPSETSPADDAVNVGGGFVPSALTTTPDSLGNFLGNPAFVAPRDPRPGSDGPATFFLDANFDLTSRSAAIDAALNSVAPTTDFLSRGRVKIPGRGFPGTGPADVGAFEYKGTGGITVGGAFRVATSSISLDGSAINGGSTVFSPQSTPSSIIVTFSDSVNRATVTPSSLVLYGDGLASFGGARSTSVTWLDNHTAQFNLSGGFSSQGSVVVKVLAGTIKSTSGATILGFTDFFRIKPTGAAVPTPTKPVTPPPAPSPTSIVKASVVPTVTAALTTPGLTPAPAASPTSTTVPAHHLKHPKRTFFRRGTHHA